MYSRSACSEPRSVEGLLRSPERLRMPPAKAADSHTSPIFCSFVGRGATSTPRRRSTLASSRHSQAAAEVLSVLRTRRWSRWLHATARNDGVRCIVRPDARGNCGRGGLRFRLISPASRAWSRSSRRPGSESPTRRQGWVRIGLHPATRLSDRDQSSATASHNSQLVHHVSLEEVDADPERVSRLDLRHSQPGDVRFRGISGRTGWSSCRHESCLAPLPGRRTPRPR
jgi:hypothetical protein